MGGVGHTSVVRDQSESEEKLDDTREQERSCGAGQWVGAADTPEETEREPGNADNTHLIRNYVFFSFSRKPMPDLP